MRERSPSIARARRWRSRKTFSSEDALKVHVTEEQKSLVGVKRLSKLFKEEAQGFSEALFHLHGCGNGRKKVALLSEAAASIAEEREPCAGSKHREDNSDPRKDMKAARFALDNVHERNHQR